MGIHVARAGAGPVVAQLVVHPLTGYRAVNLYPWGANYLLTHQSFTWPALLFYLPMVIPVTALRAAVAWVDRWDRRMAETLLVLAVFGGAAIAFTMNLPDRNAPRHDHAGGPDRRRRARDVDAPDRRTARNVPPEPPWDWRWSSPARRSSSGTSTRPAARYPILHETSFGWLRFASEADVADMETVRLVVEQTPRRDLFCYPVWASVYLMTGARNPTRHDLVFPKYQNDAEYQV